MESPIIHIYLGGEVMLKEISDRKGQIIKVYITDAMGGWSDREPFNLVPIGNHIGTIDFGVNYYGSIGSAFYCGWDDDVDAQAVVVWESMDGHQMQDDIERLFLRAAVFKDEHDYEFTCEISYLPYARAAVCAIVDSYKSLYDEDTYEEEMNEFNKEYMPFISAIMNKSEIPEWGYDEDLF
jgi:hypothetical protein